MKKIILFALLLFTIHNANSSYIIKLKNNKNDIFQKNNQNIIKNKLRKVFETNSKNDIFFRNNEQFANYYVADLNQSEIESISEYIEFIEPNYKYRVEQIVEIPNDPKYSDQWALPAVNALNSWRKSSGKNVIIGVIDTGIDFNHDEFEGQLWINSTEDINNNGKFDPWPNSETRDGVTGDINNIDEDGNGYIDDVIGYDFVDQETYNIGDFLRHDYLPIDENAHGTIVSGVIAAKTNNSIGISGLAYDSKIMAIRAFDATGNAESDDIANAIIYAVRNGAQILNMSFGENFESYLIRDVIKYAYSQGVVMFASSGNNNWTLPHYPSDFEEVICVGAINPSFTKYGFSNYGSMLDLVAPGQEIVTTDVDNKYTTTNGTSLAAPYAAAAAALILEINPNFSPAQVKSILQETAIDLGEPKWDVQYGSGLVNPSAAVDQVSGGNISITYPYREQNINSKEKLAVIGNATSNLFNSYKVKIGKGILPDEWIYETKLDSSAILNDTLAIIDISQFQDSIYTLSLEVNLKNQNSIETRKFINIHSSNSLNFKNFTYNFAYRNSERVIIISAETSIKSSFMIKYNAENEEEIFMKRELSKTSTFHQITLNDNMMQGKNVSIELIAYNDNGDTARAKFDSPIQFPNDNFTSDKFQAKDYSIRRSYVYENAGTFYDNSTNTMIMNDISNLGFGGTYSYIFNGQDFIAVDSTQDSWLTVGYGDSNGDGITEFFGTANKQVILTQAADKNGNPFDIELFRNGNTELFWGAHFFDINKDGKEDLIGYDDSSYFVYSFTDGQYVKISSFDFGTNSITRGSAIGDFDNDGKYEIFAVTSRGEVFIIEYQNDNTFRLEFESKERISDFNQYIASGDFTGDGKIEIMQMTVSNYNLFGRNTSASDAIWQSRIFRNIGTDQYEIMHKEIFQGVRAGFIPSLGFSYRNGVSAGDVDSDGKSEFIISTFPNLYVISFEESKVKPFWIYQSTLSNSAIVHDFDNNGINEIGFSTFGNMRFFEYTSEFDLSASNLIDGWAINGNSAFLYWNSISDAENYAIFSIEEQSDGSFLAISKAITNEMFVTIEDLEPNKEYLFSVAAFDILNSTRISDFSELKAIYTFPAARAISAEFDYESNIRVRFDGFLPESPIAPWHFRLFDSNGKYILEAISAVVVGKEEIILKIDNQEIPNGDYELNIKSFSDYYGNPIRDTILPLYFEQKEKSKEIYIRSLEILSASLVKLKFSEALTKESAENVNNYELSPIGEIILASRDDFDSSLVLMNFSDRLRTKGSRGKNYTITARNIIGSSGNFITEGAGNTIGFVISQSNLDDAYIYPNPIKYEENPEIYFAGLTKSAKIRVLSIDGYEHITILENDGNGGVEWDGRDKYGNRLKPGVYIFEVSGNNSENLEIEKIIKKFVVLP